MRFSLSPRGEHSDGPPTWSEIEAQLAQAKTSWGRVTLELDDGSGNVLKTLSVTVDDNKYLLLLSEDTGDDSEIRTYWNPEVLAGWIGVLGDIYDERTICYDFKIVENAFREFFETHDVSRVVLD